MKIIDDTHQCIGMKILVENSRIANPRQQASPQNKVIRLVCGYFKSFY